MYISVQPKNKLNSPKKLYLDELSLKTYNRIRNIYSDNIYFKSDSTSNNELKKTETVKPTNIQMIFVRPSMLSPYYIQWFS